MSQLSRVNLILVCLANYVHRQSLDSDFVENSAQLVEVHRLDQVKIKSRLLAAADVFLRAKSSDRDCLDTGVFASPVRLPRNQFHREDQCRTRARRIFPTP